MAITLMALAACKPIPIEEGDDSKEAVVAYLYADNLESDAIYTLEIDGEPHGILEDVSLKPSLCDEATLIACYSTEIYVGCRRFTLLKDEDEVVVNHAINIRETEIKNCKRRDEAVPDVGEGAGYLTLSLIHI